MSILKDLNEYPLNNKGHRVVPDDVLVEYRKALPAGTINESGTYRVANSHGLLYILGSDPEMDKKVNENSISSSNRAQARRRSLGDSLKILLQQKAPDDVVKNVQGTEGMTYQDAITAAAAKQASRGNIKALEYVRDTIGEKPTERTEIGLHGLSDADRELLANVARRVEAGQPKDDDRPQDIV